jgi:hypothetical protein
MEVLGGESYSSYSFTTSALDAGEWSKSRPGCALPLGKLPPFPLYRRLGGLHSLDTEVREKIVCPCRGPNLNRPVVQFAARHYTD